MRLARVALATTLVVVTWWAGNGGADAASLDTYSWWWRGNTGPAPLPAPPTVPEGGILIGGTPEGATAVAGLQFTLASGESSPVLTLRIADEKGGEAAVIAACPAGSAFSPGERGGPWEAKPNAACELGSVNGQRDAAAGTWTFPVAPLVQGTALTIVIVPGTISPEAPVTSSFQIAFHPPDAGSLVTTSGGSESSATAEDFPSPVVTGTFDPELPSGGLDVTPGVELPVATPFSPSVPASSQGVTATAPAVEVAQRPVPVVPASSRREGAGVAFLVMLAAVGAMYYVNRVPVPPPRRLGPLSGSSAHVALSASEPSKGGLGRFARVRRGAPPPLV